MRSSRSVSRGWARDSRATVEGMNRPSKWCLPVALLLLASGCSSGNASRRGGNSLEARAEELEESNRALQAQLSQKNAQVEQAFASATQAENAAGLQGLGCAGVMPAKGAPKGLPRSGDVHARLGLAHQSYKMTATFSAPRAAGNWRVVQGNCRVTSP
jgi:Tfp pilus assembly protein FimV